MKAGEEPKTTLKPPGHRVALGTPIAVVELMVIRLFVVSTVDVGFRMSVPTMVLFGNVTVTGNSTVELKSVQII